MPLSQNTSHEQLHAEWARQQQHMNQNHVAQQPVDPQQVQQLQMMQALAFQQQQPMYEQETMRQQIGIPQHANYQYGPPQLYGQFEQPTQLQASHIAALNNHFNQQQQQQQPPQPQFGISRQPYPSNSAIAGPQYPQASQVVRMELEPVMQPAPRTVGGDVDIKAFLDAVGLPVGGAQRRAEGSANNNTGALPYSVTNNDGLSTGGSSGEKATCCAPPAHSASSGFTVTTNISTAVGANATNSNTGTSHSAIAEDQLCFIRTVESFRQYINRASAVMQHRRAQFASLSQEHKQLLDFDAEARIFYPYARGIHENHQFLLGVCRSAKTLFSGYWPHAPVPSYFDHPDFAPRHGEEEPEDEVDDNATAKLPSVVKGAEKEGSSSPTGNPSNPQERYRKQAAERQQQEQPLTAGQQGDKSTTAPTTASPEGRQPSGLAAHSPSSGTLYHTDDIIPSSIDSEKVFSTLRQCVRDWSDKGHPERAAVYGPIIQALTQYFPAMEQRQKVNVLVPGAGLSRLSVELAKLGFNACGNEFSYHMLITGHYLMNHMRCANQYTLYPYVDTTLNLVRRSDQLSAAMIPDLCTIEQAEEIQQGGLSMVAGDFLEVYNRSTEHDQWEAVVSCFFIDTAHNVLDYLTCIYKILCPGGILVNIGPLLYHFADSTSEASIELSLDEVLHAASQVGFVPITNVQLLPTTYTNNPLSMKQMVYQAAFFVLQKPFSAPLAAPQQGQKAE
eukprot:GILI01016035.1.p1 GENE.GILI01016035.1~~GILI01016035.1.p1  ORF type:complete len:730 (-),score=151.13 GILI01016035.1:180-2369(-)